MILMMFVWVLRCCKNISLLSSQSLGKDEQKQKQNKTDHPRKIYLKFRRQNVLLSHLCANERDLMFTLNFISLYMLHNITIIKFNINRSKI